MDNRIYELREKYLHELCDIYDSGRHDDTTLTRADKLAHTVKSLDCIIKNEENGYSDRMMPQYSYDDNYSNRRNQRRNSMGQYSSHDEPSMSSMMNVIDRYANSGNDQERMIASRMRDEIRRGY